MTTLYIKPVGYTGDLLDEIGSSAIKTFRPHLEDYEIGSEIEISDVNPALFYDTDFDDKDVPYPTLNIDRLLKGLATFGRLTIGVSDYPLMGLRDNDFDSWGQASPWTRTSVISTAKYEGLKDVNQEDYKQVVIKLAMHELGHLFGLGHHGEILMPKTEDGCIMINDLFDPVLFFDIVDDNSNVEGDNYLCDGCRSRLKKPRVRVDELIARVLYKPYKPVSSE